VRILLIVFVGSLLSVPEAAGQATPAPCRVLCAPEFKVEPTITARLCSVHPGSSTIRERPRANRVD
jgi:hypothetical protein